MLNEAGAIPMLEHLFSPFHVKTLQLKNRIVMPSLASFMIRADGSITEDAVEHYRRRAAGGPAMVIMEACSISSEGVVSPHQARIYDDRFMDGLALIAAAVKAEGAIPAVQLHHGGRQISAKVIGRRPLAPSPLPCPRIRGEVEPLTVDGIQELVGKFGDAAARAVQAGFELIEIHGAHGYLINQFLSKFSNIRQDAYGGDVVGRTRFAADIVREIRGRLGKGLPLSFKISAEEYVDGGLTTEESLEILKILVQAGIDIVQVSAGNDMTPEWICQPMFMEKACLLESTARVKRALDITVMAVGRINDPLTANRILRDHKADLVCIGRGLLADPDMPRKARQGRLNEIRACIACNTCMQSIFKRGRIECLVNPTLGRETEMTLTPTASPKKIMVIGSGPAGMNLAWVAAKRGHEVHVFEKRDQIGGLLLAGSTPAHKAELRSLIRFQIKQAKKNGVKFHLNRNVTPADIVDFGPEVVVLATGSLPLLPVVPGIGKGIVATYEEPLNGVTPVYRRAAVIGGGSTGCELALHLAEHGCAVTLIEMLPKVGRGLEAVTKKVLMERLQAHRVTILTGHRLVRIEDSGAVAADSAGREQHIRAEKVIISIGSRPNTRIYDGIKSDGYEIHRIGDCLEPRSAKDAIYESAVLARKL
jgi:2,4-dienoyl-CoA reductase-like NADH-dependent reductase (Old Yellow Enzyme family)/thioredoxin reductase